MIRICDWKPSRYRAKGGTVRRALPAILLAAIALPTVSSAAIIDWNAASGNWNVNTNWYDYTAAAPPASPPSNVAPDDVEIRNGGTVTLSDAESAGNLFLGFARNVELDPINARCANRSRPRRRHGLDCWNAHDAESSYRQGAQRYGHAEWRRHHHADQPALRSVLAIPAPPRWVRARTR